jgi:hypothetical protein
MQLQFCPVLLHQQQDRVIKEGAKYSISSHDGKCLPQRLDGNALLSGNAQSSPAAIYQ